MCHCRYLLTRLDDFIASDCALTLERTIDLPTMASDNVRQAFSRGSSMKDCSEWSTRVAASSFPDELLLVDLTMEEVVGTSSPYVLARFVRTAARDSARSMAVRMAEEVDVILLIHSLKELMLRGGGGGGGGLGNAMEKDNNKKMRYIHNGKGVVFLVKKRGHKKKRRFSKQV